MTNENKYWFRLSSESAAKLEADAAKEYNDIAPHVEMIVEKYLAGELQALTPFADLRKQKLEADNELKLMAVDRAKKRIATIEDVKVFIDAVFTEVKSATDQVFAELQWAFPTARDVLQTYQDRVMVAMGSREAVIPKLSKICPDIRKLTGTGEVSSSITQAEILDDIERESGDGASKSL